MLLSWAVHAADALAVWAADCATPDPNATELGNPAPCAPPGMAGIANQWIAWAKWGCLVAGALGLLMSAAMMMIGRRNRSHLAGEGATGLPWVVAGLSLAALAVPIATSVLNAASAGG